MSILKEGQFSQLQPQESSTSRRLSNKIEKQSIKIRKSIPGHTWPRVHLKSAPTCDTTSFWFCYVLNLDKIYNLSKEELAKLLFIKMAMTESLLSKLTHLGYYWGNDRWSCVKWHWWSFDQNKSLFQKVVNKIDNNTIKGRLIHCHPHVLATPPKPTALESIDTENQDDKQIEVKITEATP